MEVKKQGLISSGEKISAWNSSLEFITQIRNIQRVIIFEFVFILFLSHLIVLKHIGIYVFPLTYFHKILNNCSFARRWKLKLNFSHSLNWYLHPLNATIEFFKSISPINYTACSILTLNGTDKVSKNARQRLISHYYLHYPTNYTNV